MRKLHPKVYLILFFITYNCQKIPERKISQSQVTIIEKKEDSLIYKAEFIADSFDFPIGKPNDQGYYNAQKFQENRHLGDDWNAVTGGNSDLGNPIYAIANGYVIFAEDYQGGWGNVMRIIHKLPNGNFVESLYAHCDVILVTEKSWIKKGAKIATIGTANGQYLAHLHFEIRDNLELPIGSGYSDNTIGYLDPTQFIKDNR